MKWLAAFALLITFNSAIGQVLTRQYIENRIVKFNPKTKGQPITMYVINGQPFFLDRLNKRDSILSQLDSILHKISYQDVAFIYGISNDEVSFAEVPGRVVAIVATKGKERKKEKKHELKKAIAKYDKTEIYNDHISTDSKDPVLMIDDKPVYFKDCYKKLTRLKLKNIYAITIYDQPVPDEDYGENARNGLIEIWTYSGKK